MKQATKLCAVLCLLTAVILLPVAASVNHISSNPAIHANPQSADGSPLPPFPHAKPSLTILSADGSPLPPFPHAKPGSHQAGA
ncbi:MAG: hypothetical protein LAN61_07170 [Acidobacteriia bacterium]|nr:hypothetical protein [Terriglobia bacterium]